MMIYGYARCSTAEKEKLQDINRQKRELKEMGAIDKTIYFEFESGTKTDRAELEKLLDVAKKGDVIVTLEVSRLTRSVRHFCDVLQKIQEKGLKLIIKDSVTVDCSKTDVDPMSRAFLQMSAVFAELERNIISQRVKSGMDNARENGKQIGRKIVTVDDVPSSFTKHYPLYKKGALNKKELAKICDISYPTVFKYLRLVEGK